MRRIIDDKYEVLVTSRCPYCANLVLLARQLGASANHNAYLLHAFQSCTEFVKEMNDPDPKKLITAVLKLASEEELVKFANRNLEHDVN